MDYVAYIIAFALLRRVQGAENSGVDKLVQKALYVTLCVALFWPVWGAGLLAGAVTILFLVWRPDFTPPYGALKRYGPFGLGYWPAYRFTPHLCWSCFGELWLGGSWGAFLVVIKGYVLFIL